MQDLTVSGVRIPRLVYGTAWKEARTEALVSAALRAGFRGIDTANQRKHYHEAGVGAALQEALARGDVAREDVFVQTKFTHLRGQARSASEGADAPAGASSDHRLPYDPAAPVATQVAQSMQSSLQHLGVERVDAYVLHGPSIASGLAPADLAAWRAMEEEHAAGRARLLGVSNVTLAQLKLLCDAARVPPSVVQNRTLVLPEADHATRAFCHERGIVYEGFSLLTAAPQLIGHPLVQEAADATGLPRAAMLLRLWAELGMVVLTGTTDPEHMAADLAAFAAEVPREIRDGFVRLANARTG